MCLEPLYVSLKSPKNSDPRYSTMSQNHLVKVCRRSKCPFGGQSLRSQDSRQQPACCELQECKQRGIATIRDQFSQCSNSPKEIHDIVASPCSNFKVTNDWYEDHGATKRSCSSSSDSDSHRGSKRSAKKSSREMKRHTAQQTEPERSWQTRCSNFIINLPMTLSDKLFGPRTNCEILTYGKRGISDNGSRTIRSHPVAKDSSKLGSKDQRNKNSVKSRASSLEDCGSHKNIREGRICREKENPVGSCYSRIRQSIQESVPCGGSVLESVKSNVIREKLTSKCCGSSEDNFARLGASGNHSNGFDSRGSNLDKLRFMRGEKNQTNSSISRPKKRGTSFLSFSNWPAILSEKFFSPKNERFSRCCGFEKEVKYNEANREVADGQEIVSEAGSPCAAKKGRLLLKRYTISQTSEAREETLCFDILPDEQINNPTKTKLQSQVCLKMASENHKRLETIKERKDVVGKCIDTGKSRESKGCPNSKSSVKKSNSRKTLQRMEKKTSTEQIYLSSLFSKLLKRHKDEKNVCGGKNSHGNTASGHRAIKKRTFGHRANTVARKYATTSIYTCRNARIKCPRYVGRDSRKKEGVLSSLERNVSADCCTVDFPDVPGKDQTRRKISRDYSSGRRVASEEASTRAHLSEDNLEDVKVNQIMTRRRTVRPNEKSGNETEYQGCVNCGSSRAGNLVKSGVLQVIDNSCRRELRELYSSHERKHRAKSNVRDKFCHRISSPKNFHSDVKKTQRIKCHREESPLARVCEGLIAEENEIPDPKKDQSPQFSARESQKTFLLAGEKILVKIFHDPEICTVDFPGSTLRQSSECPGEQTPDRKLLHTQIIIDKDLKKVRTCYPSRKPGANSINDGTQHPKRQILSQEPGGCHSQSKSREGGFLPEEKGEGSVQKEPKNAMQISVDCEECVGSPREDNACKVDLGGILGEEDTLKNEEQDVGKVFSSLLEEAREECGNTVCGSESCLCKALIKSETERGQRITKDDEFWRRQNTAVESPPRVDQSSTSLVAMKVRRPDAKSDSSNESGGKNVARRKIDNSEKLSSWIKSSGKDLSITKPESRNIINSYYSQRKNEAGSRREAHHDEHGKGKKGKAQRDGSASDKSITKARKPFQRIENVRQVGRSTNATINADKSKKRDTVLKENKIANETAPIITRDGGVFHNDTKNHLLMNLFIDNPNLSIGSTAIPKNNYTPSVQKSQETDPRNPETQAAASKIPKKLGPVRRSETLERKARESSNSRLKENSREKWMKNQLSKTADSKTDGKEVVKASEKIREKLESVSPNRPTRSIDIRDTEGNEGQRDLKAPAYILDKGNVKAKTLQMEMSSVEEQKFSNGTIVKGSGRIAKGGEGSKSSKSPSLQRSGEEKEDGRSRNTEGEKKTKENKEKQENQSKSKTPSKKNEKNKESTPLKLLSQNDSEVDACYSTVERVTTSANLFAGALMDGKNNIKSYRDLQFAVEENSHFNRISRRQDEGLPKSTAATAQSKPKVLKPSKNSRTSAKKTPLKSKSDKKSEGSKESANKTTGTLKIADKNRTKNIRSIGNEKGNEELKEDSGLTKADLTADSLNAVANDTEACRCDICRNNRNSDRNVELKSAAKNSKKIDRPKEDHSLASGNDSKRSSIALGNSDFEKSSVSRRENEVSSKNIADEKSKEQSSHERLLCKFRVSAPCTESGTPTSSSRLEIGDLLASEVKCKRSPGPECEDKKSKEQCKGFQNSIYDKEKEIMQHDYDDVPKKLTSFCTSEKMIRDALDRNFRFAKDLKRFLEQGQEFFTPKRNSDQINSCSDDKHEPTICDSEKSNEGKATTFCTKTECCERADYQKLKKSSDLCDEERASNDSVSSLQKAYSTLKTILNKTKNIHKGFMNSTQTKGTQIDPPILEESDTLVGDCFEPCKSGKSVESKMSKDDESLTLSISFGSSIFSDSNLPTCCGEKRRL